MLATDGHWLVCDASLAVDMPVCRYLSRGWLSAGMHEYRMLHTDIIALHSHSFMPLYIHTHYTTHVCMQYKMLMLLRQNLEKTMLWPSSIEICIYSEATMGGGSSPKTCGPSH